MVSAIVATEAEARPFAFPHEEGPSPWIPPSPSGPEPEGVSLPRRSPPSPCRDGAPLGVSFIIPAYNEVRRLGRTLEQYIPVMEALTVPWELIVVISGTDGTRELVEALHHPGIRIKARAERMGKGRAIMEGFKLARYSSVGYADADASVPAEDLAHIIKVSLGGAPAVIASRRLDPALVAIRENTTKFWSSRVWHAMVHILLDLPEKDLECGCKFFNADVRDMIVKDVAVTNWVFDVCMLYHVKSLGLPLKEVAVRYRYDFASKMRLGKVMFSMTLTLVGIFLYHRTVLGSTIPRRWTFAALRRFQHE